MNSLFYLILLGFFVLVIQSRPSQMEENDSQEDLEYESDHGSPGEDSLEDSQFGDEDSRGQELEQSRRLLDSHKNAYLQKNVAEDPEGRTKFEMPDGKLTRNREVRNDKTETMNTNDNFQTYGKRHQMSKYIENNDANDQLEVAQHLTNHEVNNIRNNRMHNNMIFDSPLSKRTVDSKKTPSEEGDVLFENNRDQISKVNRNDVNNNEQLELNQRPAHTKQYLNPMQENKAMLESDNENSKYLYYSRDRRAAENLEQRDSDSSVETGNENIDKTDNEREEMAIKNHIKKMSGDELEQLLNTLSEEKRTLLKKIIADVDISEKSYDSLSKREITKKAGAAEDSGDVDIGQSESNKIQAGLASLDMSSVFPTAKLETTETSKQPDTHAENVDQKQSLQINPGGGAPEKPDNSLNSIAVQNEQITLKPEKKRETNLEDVADIISFEDPKILENESTMETSEDEGYLSPQDESIVKFADEVQQSSSNDDSKINKREIDEESEFDSKLKSLEESFPNSDTYDGSAPYSGPLIRVKRKSTDQVMKKRSAALLPDAKVGYFPYNAESDVDDTDEGNEFDDDGFYDPSPNFVSNDNKNVDINSQQTGKDETGTKLDTIDQAKSPISDADRGALSLGSDTDNVLSSVEGVDENLMFSSGTRNRRKSDVNLDKNTDGNNSIQCPEINSANDKTTAPPKMDDVQNYQENDSFGGFPRNYEGDLGRYKRIRRVQSHRMQSHNSKESLKT